MRFLDLLDPETLFNYLRRDRDIMLRAEHFYCKYRQRKNLPKIIEQVAGLKNDTY